MFEEALKSAAERVTMPIARRIRVARATGQAALTGIKEIGIAARISIVDKATLSTKSTAGKVIDGVASGSKAAVAKVIDGLAGGSKVIVEAVVDKVSASAAEIGNGSSKSIVGGVVDGNSAHARDIVNAVVDQAGGKNTRSEIAGASFKHINFSFLNIHIHTK